MFGLCRPGDQAYTVRKPTYLAGPGGAAGAAMSLAAGDAMPSSFGCVVSEIEDPERFTRDHLRSFTLGLHVAASGGHVGVADEARNVFEVEGARRVEVRHDRATAGVRAGL